MDCMGINARVYNCMTEMKDVFGLNDQWKLPFDVLTEIFKSGHSHMPQDKFGRMPCVGLLYVTDLIVLDPDDAMSATQIINAFKQNTPPIAWNDDTLQHLAFVQHIAINKDNASISAYHTSLAIDLDNSYEYVGIITLEDAIEHVLQTQLIDEHDNFVGDKHMSRTNRLNHIDWNMLYIFDHRQRVSTTLPPQDLRVVHHFLSETIKNLLATSSVMRVVVNHDDQVINGKITTFERRITQNITVYESITQRDPYKILKIMGYYYSKEKATKYFTLVFRW